jgi:tRNA pseudouridine13 synthase
MTSQTTISTGISSKAVHGESKMPGLVGCDLTSASGLTTASRSTRRAARLRVEVELDASADGYIARFELPKGSYATVVMRELVKGEPALPEEEG